MLFALFFLDNFKQLHFIIHIQRLKLINQDYTKTPDSFYALLRILLKKYYKKMENTSKNKVGIIGAGTMGISIAVDLVSYGIQCVLIDVSDSILENSEKEILKGVRFAPLLKTGYPKINEQDILKHLCFSKDLSELKDCKLIIENVTEDLEIKKEVYTNLNKYINTNTKIGVNTSCISITKIASLVKYPENVIGIHFMNPVILKPTVEIMKAVHTSDDTIEYIKSFLSGISKDCVIVSDNPGFVSNRISHLFMNEAAFVFQDKVANAAEIDKIFKQCFNHKMGPLETADLIGIDTVVNSLDVLYQSFQDPKFRCCPLMRRMVDAGYLGRKTGKGFYEYN